MLPIQDGQPCLKNLPLKNSQFALSAIFWPDDMRLQIRKRIGIRTLFYQLQIRYEYKNEARDDNDNIRVANEAFARKMKIITIITHFQVYVLLQFAES